MDGLYEVLSPWADADAIKLKGLKPRVADLNGKTVGFYVQDHKIASRPIAVTIERKLKKRFPTVKTSTLYYPHLGPVNDFPEEKAKLDRWVNEVDMVIAGGYGDNTPSTIIDCTGSEPEIVREGKGVLV